MSNRLKFQGLCLVSSEGWANMRTSYDKLPAHIRLMLQNSPFNLCAACVEENRATAESMGLDRSDLSGNPDYFAQTIALMEEQIRKQES